MAKGPRSLVCEKRAYIRFVNTLDNDVELFWLDFVGRKKMYQLLRRDQFVDVNTYQTHPWTAADRLMKKELYIDGEIYYYPQTSAEYLRRIYPNRLFPDNVEGRITVYITEPLRTLKFIAMRVVRKGLTQPSDAEKLVIPRTLVNELKRTFSPG